MYRKLANLGLARSQCIMLRADAIKQTITSNYQQTRSLREYRERTQRAMYWRSRSFDAVKYNERRRDEWQEWNYRSEIFAFSRRLQENLSEDTLREIFAHKSYVEKLRQNESSQGMPAVNINSNEDLIVRGSKLLDDCVLPYLRYTFSKLPEDGIKSIASYIKSESVLADVAKWIGCKDLILTRDWPPSERDMADTVLAVVAGVERDLGEARVRRFVVDMILTYLNDKDILDDVWKIPNPRETLNLILKNSQLPAYEPRLMFQTGVKTIEPCHVIGLYVNERLMGSSAGETIDIAHDCAALISLENIFDLGDSRPPYVYGEASEKIDYKSHTMEHRPIKEWTFKLE